MWCLRTPVNETLGISPFQAAFGRIGIEPLQLLFDDWVGKRPLPLDIAKAPLGYLQDLERKLPLASEYATEHAAHEQARHTHAYNLRSREKSLEVGERVIYLMPSSTHKLTRTWQGPCVVVHTNSSYSYIIEVNGKQKWCHANHLRKYNERITEVVNHNCSIIFDSDSDFGAMPTIQFTDQNVCKSNTHFDASGVDVRDVIHESVAMPSWNVDETNVIDVMNSQYQSAVILNDSCDVYTDQSLNSLLPSARIDRSKLIHLSIDQQQELLQLIDEFRSCFDETPG